MAQDSDFRFNDEFFLDNDELKRMEKTYPLVGFAFYTPEASELFAKIDSESRKAKHSFQFYGLSTVGLALLALLLAAFDPIFLIPAADAHQFPVWLPKAVAALAAISGVTAVLIGWAGLGIGKRKYEWLKYRFICERLRQWQAQYICAHIVDIVAAAESQAGKRNYINARSLAFAQFKSDYVTNVGARLSKLLDSGNHDIPEFFVDHDFEQKIGVLNEEVAINLVRQSILNVNARIEFMSAYDRIRFRGQVEYAEYMRGEGRISTHPKTQQKFIGILSYGALITILVIHIAVIIGVFFGIPALKASIVHFLAIASALFGLALRVLQDGLQPEAHILRLEGYLDEIVVARSRFRATDELSMKIREMRVLEEAAARELFGFIKTAAVARYVL